MYIFLYPCIVRDVAVLHIDQIVSKSAPLQNGHGLASDSRPNQHPLKSDMVLLPIDADYCRFTSKSTPLLNGHDLIIFQSFGIYQIASIEFTSKWKYPHYCHDLIANHLIVV